MTLTMPGAPGVEKWRPLPQRQPALGHRLQRLSKKRTTIGAPSTVLGELHSHLSKKTNLPRRTIGGTLGRRTLGRRTSPGRIGKAEVGKDLSGRPNLGLLARKMNY